VAIFFKGFVATKLGQFSGGILNATVFLPRFNISVNAHLSTTHGWAKYTVQPHRTGAGMPNSIVGGVPVPAYRGMVNFRNIYNNHTPFRRLYFYQLNIFATNFYN